ncbi:MAG: InlB B-repeat-containing protein, partial [Clostridiales bacterium]|nr:InlB B-repeat-containing protein [Clostridiales bacterium]
MEKKQKTRLPRRALSGLLVAALVLGMVAVGGIVSSSAYAVGDVVIGNVLTADPPPALLFTAPETIWLRFNTGTISSSSKGTSSVTDAFSNITNGSATQPTGAIAFSYPGATNIRLSARYGDNTTNPDMGTGLINPASGYSDTMDSLFSPWTSGTGTFSATMNAGINLGFTVNQNASRLIEWTILFRHPGYEKGTVDLSAKAYSVVRAPSTEVSGASAYAGPPAGTYSKIASTGIFAIMGLHNVKVKDNDSFIGSGSGTISWSGDNWRGYGVPTASLRKALASTALSSLGDWNGTSQNNTWHTDVGYVSGNPQSTGTATAASTIMCVNGWRSALSAADLWTYALNSEAGTLYVDSSRFLNLNQIPGLRAAMIQTEASGTINRWGHRTDSNRSSFLTVSSTTVWSRARTTSNQNANQFHLGKYFGTDFKDYIYTTQTSGTAGSGTGTISISLPNDATDQTIPCSGNVMMFRSGATASFQAETAYQVDFVVKKISKDILRKDLRTLETSGTVGAGEGAHLSLAAGTKYARLPDQFITNATAYNQSLRDATWALGNPLFGITVTGENTGTQNMNTTQTAINAVRLTAQTASTITATALFYDCYPSVPIELDVFTNGTNTANLTPVAAGSLVKGTIVDLTSYTFKYAIAPDGTQYNGSAAVAPLAAGYLAYGTYQNSPGWKFYYEPVYTYYITYDPGVGDGAQYGPFAYAGTDKILAHNNASLTYSKANSVFTGWSPAAVVGSDVQTLIDNKTIWTNGPGTFDKSLTLTAQWDFAPHTVTYHSNNGAGLTRVANQKYNDNYTITGNTDGWTNGSLIFQGWSTDPGATTADTIYTPGNSVTITGNLVLYAVWSADKYDVTYHANKDGSDTTSWADTNGATHGSAYAVL